MLVVKFMGGVGNQLFQLNFCYYLRELYPNVEIRSDISYFTKYECHGGYLIDNNPFPIIDDIKLQDFKYIGETTNLPILSNSRNYYFEGYWQHTNFLKKEYSYSDFFNLNGISEEILSIEKLILNQKENSVALHVRCGDYNDHPDLGAIATKAYYNNAIEEMKHQIENPYFFIFSNDIEWAKANLNIDSNAYFVNSNNAKQQAIWDIYLMSLCSNFIISNSSFSWWAQKFQLYEKKIVITPAYWVNEVNNCTDKNGIISFQNYSYMKSVVNIPYSKKNTESRQKIAIIFEENKSILNTRRFIATYFSENKDNCKLYVVSKNKKIRRLVEDYGLINTEIEYLNQNKKKRIQNLFEYILYIKGKFYFKNNQITKLLNEIDENSNYREYIIPYTELPSEMIKTNIESKVDLKLKCKLINKGKYKIVNNSLFCVIDKKITILNKIKRCVGKIINLIKK